jgi:hypothetical protein
VAKGVNVSPVPEGWKTLRGKGVTPVGTAGSTSSRPK